MPAQKLKNYLDQHGIQYVTISHSPAYTAQRIAELAHIPGKELAKTVIVKIDDKFAMAVLPASRRVNLRHLKKAIGADEVVLSSEREFKELFNLVGSPAHPVAFARPLVSARARALAGCGERVCACCPLLF